MTTKKTPHCKEADLRESAPCGFHFPLKTIVMSIRLVVFGLLSLRGAKRTFHLFNKWFEGGLPCHVVIQNWILRFGLYKLRQAVEKRDDWVYILDHTIEFGAKKCLVVLGITLETFRGNNCLICHRDVEVLDIRIEEKATAASVTKALHGISRSTGPPVQVLSDGGGNLKKGIRDFVREVECDFTIRQTYDVTHKAALILKHYLKDDEFWKLFVHHTSRTKRSLAQTLLGFISPSKPRDKARWLNLDSKVNWAEMISSLEVEKLNEMERKKFNEKLSWVQTFDPCIKEWRTMLEILLALKNEVKANGLCEKAKCSFENSIIKLQLNTPRLREIRDEALGYLEEECTEMSGVYPGCSDIIESVFGKYKNFSGKSPMKEVGKAVLTIPVFTSNVNYDEVKAAMETISTKDVKAWLDENIGESLFAKRKKAFSHKKTKSSVKNFSEIVKKAAGF